MKTKLPNLSNSELENLCEVLKQAESYALPESLQQVIITPSFDTNSSNDSNDSQDLQEKENEDQSKQNQEKLLQSKQDLLERYENARKKYMKYRQEQLFFSHLTTYKNDGGSKNGTPSSDDGNESNSHFEFPSVPSDKEQEDLQQKLREVQQRVLNKAQDAQASITNFQTKYSSFIHKRMELKDMIKDLKQNSEQQSEKKKSVHITNLLDSNNKENLNTVNKNNGKFDSTVEDSDGDSNDPMDVDYDEEKEQEEYIREGERLKELEKKKSELQMKLSKLQRENLIMKQNVNDKNEQLQKMMDTNPELIHLPFSLSQKDSVSGTKDASPTNSKLSTPQKSPSLLLTQESEFSSMTPMDSQIHSPVLLSMNENDLETMEKKNEELKSKIEELKEIKSFYDLLRETMEELGGIKIISVDANKTLKEVDTDHDEINTSRADILLRLRILQDHEIRIGLMAVPLSAFGYSGSGTNGHNEDLRIVNAEYITPNIISDPTNTISLKLQPFDNLIKVSRKLPPVSDIRFVIRETMAHIQVIKQRVVELKLISNEAVTKIGPLYDPDTKSMQDQEIVCSFNDGCVTAVFRLTQDCPLPIAFMPPGGKHSCGCYVEKLIGFNWTKENSEKYLDEIKHHLDNNFFEKPIHIVQYIKNEITKLKIKADGQSSDNILPKTPPALPIMNKIINDAQCEKSAK